MSKDKELYVFQDGLRPLLGEKICQAVQKFEGALTLMFDKTTTAQVKKQMDLLLTYWDEESEEVVTKYLESLFFGRATAVDILKCLVKFTMVMSFMICPGKSFFFPPMVRT